MSTYLQVIRCRRHRLVFFLVMLNDSGPASHACACVPSPQSRLTLCDPTDCGPPGFSVDGHSPGKDTEVGCHALFQGIFPTQGLNPGLPHHRQIIYHLSYQASPRILDWVSLLQRIFLTQELDWGLLHCRWILSCLNRQLSRKPPRAKSHITLK